MSLLEGATITPTGGTALTVKASTNPQGTSIKAYVNEDEDLRTRRTMEFSVSEPKVNAASPNGYTLARNSIFAKIPFTLDNGLVTTHTIQIKMARDAEASSAEILEMRKLGAQLLIDGDLDDFYNQLAVV
jgi:hypothetical protein